MCKPVSFEELVNIYGVRSDRMNEHIPTIK